MKVAGEGSIGAVSVSIPTDIGVWFYISIELYTIFIH